ncbi:hypothetical protein U0070_006983 [Myodes glareolus]|uniref:Uncharacterized protein n=1 Tax=Myodes glareolus TaxID=447135 RepID=A0AAW0ICJ9_MYOGA
MSQEALEIISNHSITEAIRPKSRADKNDISVKEQDILLDETALLSSTFSHEAPQAPTNRIYRMTKLGQSFDEDFLLQMKLVML